MMEMVCVKYLFMLNLPVAMLKNALIVSLFLFSNAFGLIAANGPEIDSPGEGQIVQGNVEVIGTIPGDGFESAELLYGYANDSNDNWFWIASISQPATVSTLTIWDTTTISDGNYRLKLAVYYQDGSTDEFVVDQVLVRNYTVVEATPTMEVIAAGTSVEEEPNVTETPGVFSATAYPQNRASLSINKVEEGFVSGMLVGVFCMVGLGVYTIVRAWRRGR